MRSAAGSSGTSSRATACDHRAVEVKWEASTGRAADGVGRQRRGDHPQPGRAGQHSPVLRRGRGVARRARRLRAVAALAHRWQIEAEDTIVLTIRWPSRAGDAANLEADGEARGRRLAELSARPSPRRSKRCRPRSPSTARGSRSSSRRVVARRRRGQPASRRAGDCQDVPVGAGRSHAQRRAQLEKAVWALGQLRSIGPLSVRALQRLTGKTPGSSTSLSIGWAPHRHRAQLATSGVRATPRRHGAAARPGHGLWHRAAPDHAAVFAGGRGPGHAGHAGADQGAGQASCYRRGAPGRGAVSAVEIEPVAAAVCLENVERNKVDHIVEVTAQGRWTAGAEQTSISCWRTSPLGPCSSCIHCSG